MDRNQIKVSYDLWLDTIRILLLQLKPEGLAGVLVSSCMACGFVLFFLGFPFVEGHSVFWRTEVDDVTQYVAGFNFFFTSPWQSPWLAFDALNYPHGTLTTFVDAIPLYSLILKLLIPQDWAPFNPYGVWVALCFLLQAIGAWWITRELKVSSWVFLITLVCLLLSFPAFLARLSHTSLMSHWLLLFALALYLKSRRSDNWPDKAWLILCLVAFYVNIYLFTMVCGVFGCAWLSAKQHGVLVRARALLWPIAILGVTAFFAMWPLPSGKPMPEWGFGFYSMNMLSPWVGGYILPSAASWLGLSPIVEFAFTGGPGQSEGFNYLGLGVVILLFWSGLSSVKRIKDHKYLSALLVIFCVYALSNQVWFGSLVVMDLKYPKFLLPLTSQFRASGRFFWLVGYVLLVFILYKTYQSKTPRLFATIACGVLLLQVIDLKGVYKELNLKLNHEPPQIIHTDQWDAALGDDSKVLYLYPKFKCGLDHQKSLLPLMKYASERKLKLNTGYIARYTPDCFDMKDEISKSDPTISAYVITQDAIRNVVKLETIFPASWSVRCQHIDFANVCRVTSLKAIQ